MIAKKMIIDPDHLSVRARQQLLDIVEKERYSGIVSSHSWSTPDSIPRIYRAGGFVTPYAGTPRTSSTPGARSRSCATRASTAASAGART